MMTSGASDREAVFDIADLEALRVYAHGLIKRLHERQILLLNGPVGAGKTQLTRLLLEELGCDETVSPSYAIHNQYSTPRRGEVDHIDLYRVESEDDLESTGFWDLFSQPEGLVIIEWADRLKPGTLPRSWKMLKIDFEVTGTVSRRLREQAV